MNIKFIGTQHIGGKCTSYVIDEHVLFDCGFGTVRTMLDAGLLEKIDTVIISHLHPDHVADIVYFVLSCCVKKRPCQNLTIVAPTGARQFIQNLNQATFCGDWNDNLDEYLAYFNTVMANMVELADGQIFTGNQITVNAFQVVHGMANSNAYIVKAGDKVLGCSGDTSFCPALVAHIPQAPVWFIEATYDQDRGGTRHLSLEKVTQLADANPDIKFYTVHRNNYPQQTKCKNVFFPHDGDVIKI